MNLDHVFLMPCIRNKGLYALAAIRSDRKGKILNAYAEHVAPKNDEDSHLGSHQEVLRSLSAAVIDNYDRSFVTVAHGMHNVIPYYAKILPVNDYWLDTSQLAWPMVMNQEISDKRSFKELCSTFGIVNEAPGTATGDCEALCRLYWAMMARFKTSLFGEEVVREIGGKALSSVRKMFGV